MNYILHQDEGSWGRPAVLGILGGLRCLDRCLGYSLGMEKLAVVPILASPLRKYGLRLGPGPGLLWLGIGIGLRAGLGGCGIEVGCRRLQSGLGEFKVSRVGGWVRSRN